METATTATTTPVKEVVEEAVKPQTNRLPEYLKGHKVKALIKAHGRRSGPEFLLLLDKKVEQLVIAACQVHNGGKKTLDATVAGYAGISA